MTPTESRSAITYVVDHISPTVLFAFAGFVTLFLRVSWEARFQADVTLALLGSASILGVVVSFAPQIVFLVCVLAAAAARLLWKRARAGNSSVAGVLVLVTVTMVVGLLVAPAVGLMALVGTVLFVEPPETASEGGALPRKNLRSYIAAVVVPVTVFGSFLGSGMWIPLERVSTGTSTRVGYILSMDEYEFRMLEERTRRLVNVPRDATATHHTCHGGNPIGERLVRPLPDFVLHGWRAPTPTC